MSSPRSSLNRSDGDSGSIDYSRDPDDILLSDEGEGEEEEGEGTQEFWGEDYDNAMARVGSDDYIPQGRVHFEPYESKTKLIVPPEVINMPVDMASRDKDLCSKLEDLLIQWNKSIREALAVHVTAVDPEAWTLPLDELDFWKHKFVDLHDLVKQLRSQPIRVVRDIMLIIKSPYVNSFNKASMDILYGATEAYSNLHYLGAIRPICVKIQRCRVRDLWEHLVPVLWIVRVIWLNAPYYNTHDKLNGLLRKFSNAFILKCQQSIRVSQVFDGWLDSAESSLKQCLDVLNLWRTKYFEAQKMHSMYSYTNWFLEYEKIFVHVDAFIQRLRDLLEISACERLFARRGEGFQAEIPKYTGSKAADIAKVLLEVGRMCDRNVKTLGGYSRIALNVRHAEWHHYMRIFKMAIKDMEMMIQTVLLNAFDVITEIEEGILLMETYYHFCQRESLQRVYDKLTLQLYKLFEQEIFQVKRLQSEHTVPPRLLKDFPPLVGRGAWALFVKQKLDTSYGFIKDAYWLPECGFGEEVLAQYRAISSALGTSCDQYYNEWLNQVGTEDLTPRLDIPLMIRSPSQHGMIEVNFDRVLNNHIAEAEIWSKLGREIPDVLITVFNQKERLEKVRETAQLVATDYNTVVSALSPDERLLFKERIKLIDRKVYPGLTRLTWDSDVSTGYINDCKLAVTSVENYTSQYKKANLRIQALAIKISNYLMAKIDTKKALEEDEFNETQKKFRENSILKVAIKYKDITLILRSVFEIFREDGADVKAQWLKYLAANDEIVQGSILQNFRQTLQAISGTIRSTPRGPPPPIIRLNVVKRKGKLEYSPSLAMVKDMILGIPNRICAALRPFPRVVQFLSDPAAEITSFSDVLATDSISQRLQVEISKTLNSWMRKAEKYLNQWESYRDAWGTTPEEQDAFMDRFEAMNPSLEGEFDPITGNYVEVRVREGIFSISFNMSLMATTRKISLPKKVTVVPSVHG